VSEDQLDECGCCGTPADPPPPNEPGQPALRWRLGTHSSFVARMVDAIPRAEGADGSRPLAALTTRAPDDPSIAMIDACATVCDILSFYQERIANEGYLRTAGERRSVLELARAIGYELNPGVAASSWLAFTVEEPPATAPMLPNIPLPPPPVKTPTTVTVPLGTKAQSIPAAGQQPQVYETVVAIEARVAWNAMRPRATFRQDLAVGYEMVWALDPAGVLPPVPAASLWLDGTGTGLKPGDVIAVQVTRENVDLADPNWLKLNGGMALVRVAGITVDDVHRRTRVDLQQPGGATPRFGVAPLPKAKVAVQPIPLNALDVLLAVVMREWEGDDLAAFVRIQGWDEDALVAQVAALLDGAPDPAGVHAFRQKVAPFGHAAPPFLTIAQQQYAAGTPTAMQWSNYDWTPIWKTSAGTYHSDNFGPDLHLERAVPGLAAGTLAALGFVGDPILYPVAIAGTVDGSVADFASSGKATGLFLNYEPDKVKPIAEWTTRLPQTNKDSGPGWFMRIRNTSIWVQSEKLAMTATPIEAPVAAPIDGPSGLIVYLPAAAIMLDRLVLGLGAGRVVSLSGDTVDGLGRPTGQSAKELALLARVTHVGGYTVLHFAAPLQHNYDRATLLICANVAPATHGETQPMQSPGAGTEEILGSGDGTATNQRFTLKKLPLTFVSAPTPSGAAPTLVVRVNGVEWTRVPSLYGMPPTARVYVLRLEDDGTTSVLFGDGVVGARLPTGRDNVTATYRSGLGTAGEVDAGQLTLLLAKPAGVKNVVNPVAGDGAADPEGLDDARASAPRTVRTLDRIVSVADFEDFARGFAGIGKAQALAVWSGHTRLVHVTVASATGEPLADPSALLRNLRAGIAAAGDPTLAVQVESFAPRLFKLEARVLADPRYELPLVRAAAEAAVTGAFTFARRAFAQPVTEAEIMGILHGVAGVVAVQGVLLYAANLGPSAAAGVLPAAPARYDAAKEIVLPAELLLLHPAGLSLAVSS
jgi:hypothetical protein